MATLDHATKAQQIADEAHSVVWQKDNARAPHLIALAQVYADLAKTAGPRVPDGAIVAYPNQSGAVVAVTELKQAGCTTYPWRCGGCPASHDGYSTLGYAQNDAKTHADQCTALPIPA